MLLKGDPEEITTLLGSMQSERKHIQKHVGIIVYYMQGGLNYTDAWRLSMEELAVLADVFKEHYANQANALTGGGKN
jgi:hypothetical protein